MIPLPPNLKAALNTQLNLERLNEAYYDALATQMAVAVFDGAQKFFTDSAREEHAHYQKINDYLIDRNETPVLDALQKPAVNTPSLLPAFEAAQGREKLTTQAIDELYDLAEETGDNATCQFLLWFIEEQVKSERELFDYVVELKRVGAGLGEQWFDHELLK